MSPRRSSTVLPQAAASLALALACGSSGSGPPDGPPSTLALQEVTGNLDAPVFLTAPPGDLDRLFVVEKNGVIRIIRNNAILTTPFLDITSKTTKGSEQGLLGLAFHPDYASNGLFFVSYTAPGGGNAGHSVIARYQVSANPDVAGTAEAVVLTVDQPFSNHNGGMIAFGPDGYLYFGLGDGGDGGDPLETGQDRTVREEIWNYGLRNPWRFSFDRQTGDLYIADVGQSSREEVNVVAAGAGGGQDFGWDDMEGTSCYEDSNCTSNPALRPVLDYGRGSGCAVTGGYVYRGAAIPAIQGMYFYSDYCTGFVRSFRFTGSGITESFEWDNLRRSGGVTSFGEDGRGELYIMTESGRLFRFVPP
jgi:hypothetical protein